MKMIRHMFDHQRCALWAGMGIGKTSTVLTALDWLELVEDTYPALVIAPKRVAISTWPDEVRKWDHLRHVRVSVVLGTPDERCVALRRPADIYCINYDNLVWLIETLDGKWPFKTVVPDEATRLKSFRLRQGGKRAQALSKVAFKSRRWVNLTGTPAPNGLKDLWGQTWFLDRGQRLGDSYSAFTQRWFFPTPDGYGVLPHRHAQAEIESRLADITVSLRAEDYLELPPLITNVLKVQLPPEARGIYRALERDMFVRLKSGARLTAAMKLTLTNKCLQLTAGAVYADDPEDMARQVVEEIHDAKLEALESVVEEAAGAPVLVAYHFKFELERLKRRFGKSVRPLDANPATIRAWNAGDIPILAAHPASAGHGLNLQQGGNIIAYLTSYWDSELDRQILERIGPTRQAQAGLNRPVFLHRIVAEDTLDEEVLDRLEGKLEVEDALMRAMERRDARQ